MPIFKLDQRLWFPPVELAEQGLLAVGGDLSTDRLLLAYTRGIFPWYEEGLPILWHSPDPRMVLEVHRLHVPRSLRKVMRRAVFDIRLDTSFREVMQVCGTIERPDQDGTWITTEMLDAYCKLHELGLAHSAEAWFDEELVGGLYGVCLGGAFFGESMFARVADASKVAFIALVEQLALWGVTLIDCQVHTPHLERFGAEEIPRAAYLGLLRRALDKATRRGRWRFDAGAAATGT